MQQFELDQRPNLKKTPKSLKQLIWLTSRLANTAKWYRIDQHIHDLVGNALHQWRINEARHNGIHSNTILSQLLGRCLCQTQNTGFRRREINLTQVTHLSKVNTNILLCSYQSQTTMPNKGKYLSIIISYQHINARKTYNSLFI